jgi:hypothetical protein
MDSAYSADMVKGYVLAAAEMENATFTGFNITSATFNADNLTVTRTVSDVTGAAGYLKKVSVATARTGSNQTLCRFFTYLVNNITYGAP